jgi:hypothetical protein
MHKPLREKFVFRRRHSPSYRLRGLIVPLLNAGNKRCYSEVLLAHEMSASIST